MSPDLTTPPEAPHFIDDNEVGGSLPSFLRRSEAGPTPRKVDRLVAPKPPLKGSVARFKAECETLLNERHGLRESELEFIERLQAQAIQPGKRGLAVFMTNSQWSRFNRVRRRFVEARCYALLRARRASHPPHPSTRPVEDT